MEFIQESLGGMSDNNDDNIDKEFFQSSQRGGEFYNQNRPLKRTSKQMDQRPGIINDGGSDQGYPQEEVEIEQHQVQFSSFDSSLEQGGSIHDEGSHRRGGGEGGVGIPRNQQFSSLDSDFDLSASKIKQLEKITFQDNGQIQQASGSGFNRGISGRTAFAPQLAVIGNASQDQFISNRSSLSPRAVQFNQKQFYSDSLKNLDKFIDDGTSTNLYQNSQYSAKNRMGFNKNNSNNNTNIYGSGKNLSTQNRDYSDSTRISSHNDRPLTTNTTQDLRIFSTNWFDTEQQQIMSRDETPKTAGKIDQEFQQSNFVYSKERVTSCDTTKRGGFRQIKYKENLHNILEDSLGTAERNTRQYDNPTCVRNQNFNYHEQEKFNFTDSSNGDEQQYSYHQKWESGRGDSVGSSKQQMSDGSDYRRENAENIEKKRKIESRIRKERKIMEEMHFFEDQVKELKKEMNGQFQSISENQNVDPYLISLHSIEPKIFSKKKLNFHQIGENKIPQSSQNRLDEFQQLARETEDLLRKPIESSQSVNKTMIDNPYQNFETQKIRFFDSFLPGNLQVMNSPYHLLRHQISNRGRNGVNISNIGFASSEFSSFRKNF